MTPLSFHSFASGIHILVASSEDLVGVKAGSSHIKQ